MVKTNNIPFGATFYPAIGKMILANMTHIELFMNKQLIFFEIFAPTLSYALFTFVDKSSHRKELVVIPVT
jgi:hypothetical protein